MPLHPDSLPPSPARPHWPSPAKPTGGKGHPGKIICTQTPTPDPYQCLWVQRMATKLTPSFSMEAWGREEVLRLKSGVQRGTGAQVPGEEGRAQEPGKMRDREGMELENEGVGRRVLGRRRAAEAEPGHRGDDGEVGGGRLEGQGNTHTPAHREIRNGKER